MTYATGAPLFESLESRTLFAVARFAHIEVGHILTITGTAAADNIVLTSDNNYVYAKLNGKTQWFARSDIQESSDNTQVRIFGLAGNDSILAASNVTLNIV